MTTLATMRNASDVEEATILGLRQAAKLTSRSDEHRLLELVDRIAVLEGSSGRDVWVRLVDTNPTRVTHDSRPADPWSDLP